MSYISPVISFTDLLSRVDDDREFMNELLALFSDELPPLMRRLEEAVLQVDLKQVEAVAHTLAGMLANLSASQAQSSAAALEHLGRNRESRGLANAFAALRKDLDAVTASIKVCLEDSYA